MMEGGRQEEEEAEEEVNERERSGVGLKKRGG